MPSPPETHESPLAAHGLRRKVRSKALLETLQIDRATLDRWIRDRVIPPPMKIGGLLFWDFEEMKAFLEGRRPASEPA